MGETTVVMKVDLMVATMVGMLVARSVEMLALMWVVPRVDTSVGTKAAV